MLCRDWLVFNSCDRCVSILAVPVHCCSLGCPLSSSSPAVFSYRVHPCFWNVNSTIPVDIVSVKSSLTLRVYAGGSRPINLTLFQSWQWPVLWDCSEMAEVWVWVSRMSRSCSLFLSCTGHYPLPLKSAQLLTHKIFS